MKKFELIIFDMDGLMFDTEKLACTIWDKVLPEYNYQGDFSFYEKIIGSNLERIRATCFEHFGNDFPFEEIKNKRYSIMNEIIEKKGVPIKLGLYELLDFLKTKDISVALATSSGRDRANFILSKTKVIPYFDYILCGDEVTKSKPDPEIFLTVAKKLNCQKENTIVLEDSYAGITAAYNAHMKPIMVPDLKMPDEDILAKTYLVCQSLLEVRDFLENIL
ncbi:MAG TPA: HAD family phosphatase [Haloplasmataceae bacterium]